MDYWIIALCAYLALAVVTFVPVIWALLQKVTPNAGGAAFDESPHFTAEEKERLKQHFTRMGGTLGFWKNTVAKYKWFHYYCLIWTIPSAILIPILTQAMTGDFYSKLLLTVISGYTAVLLAFHSGFKIEENYKGFRHGESEFYDLYRRFLDRPKSFGETVEEQINTYFQEVETVRRFVRNAETSNLATLDEARHIFKKKTPSSQYGDEQNSEPK